MVQTGVESLQNTKFVRVKPPAYLNFYEAAKTGEDDDAICLHRQFWEWGTIFSTQSARNGGNLTLESILGMLQCTLHQHTWSHPHIGIGELTRYFRRLEQPPVFDSTMNRHIFRSEVSIWDI